MDMVRVTVLASAHLLCVPVFQNYDFLQLPKTSLAVRVEKLTAVKWIFSS